MRTYLSISATICWVGSLASYLAYQNTFKGKFTDDDLKKVEGNTQELYGILQEKYGYDKDRAQKEIDNFVQQNKWH